MSLYKREADRIQDVFATSLVSSRPARTIDGNVQVVRVTPYERAIYREDTAGALARLFLDKIMRLSTRGAAGV